MVMDADMEILQSQLAMLTEWDSRPPFNTEIDDEDSEMVSSSDTEINLSIDNGEISEGVTFEPATLVPAKRHLISDDEDFEPATRFKRRRVIDDNDE